MFITCLKIFIVRAFDVSLGTLVTILTIKGNKKYATILGFIDILIWFLIVKEAIKMNNNIFIAIAFALGYAFGTFIGAYLSDILIDYNVLVQVIINGKYANKINNIRKKGYAVSKVECTGLDCKKKSLLFIETRRKKVDNLKKEIFKVDKNAFIIVNETKLVYNGFIK